LTGVDWDLDSQVRWLAEVCATHYGEVQGLRDYRNAVKTQAGVGYGPIESQVLHCFLRTVRPRRVIEVGSGISTVCTLGAMSRNEKDGAVPGELWCIEPYPRRGLSELPGMRLTRAMVQEVELAFFDQLEEGDLLFIDSSHALKVGSDVPFLYLEVIPRLRPGVYIHIHDVYLPYVYPRDVFRKFFGWQETALLLALLKGNPRLRVLCSLSALHYDRRGEMMKILADYVPQTEEREGERPEDAAGHFPSSTWLRTA
jgi:predicted O-methyltransferase YrrM